MLLDTLVLRSLRRSRVRARVLLQVAARGECYPAQLAEACGLDARRLRWALHGGLPQYRRDLGLAALGLVVEVEREGGRVVRVTEAGARMALFLDRRYGSAFSP